MFNYYFYYFFNLIELQIFIELNFLLFIVSNLLFVESPAGVGWSYSNRTSDYTCGDKSTSKLSMNISL